jgi:hypothetical protein
MRALLRAAITFALALSMPMQGFATSFLLAKEFGSIWTAAASTVVDVGRIDGARSLTEPVASVAQVSLADKESAGTQREIRPSACCSAAMAAKVWTIEAEPVSAVYARTDLPLHGGLTADVLERPPRASLA